jgi:hypothetical protein
MKEIQITSQRRAFLGLFSFGAVGGFLAGCSTPPPQLPTLKTEIKLEDLKRPKASVAKTPKEYRMDAAKHLYEANHSEIYTGKLPPLLYAIGVLRVDISANGDVRSLDWMRKPAHAPEVIEAIEKRIRQASPFPAPILLGGVTYTETWLWHKSGRYQLDTLTEGQT